MPIQLSNRLETIASNIDSYRYIVDVGTDHCLLPIFLKLENKIDGALVTDVNEGPLCEAQKNITHYQLKQEIETRLGNGLSVISPNDHVDVIVIAGMGGKLITDILNTGLSILPLNKRLILQPNVNEEKVRTWLCENHYEIVKEEILKEDDIFYEIIVADRIENKKCYSDKEIKFGPVLLETKSPLFIEKWKNILHYKKETEKNIPSTHPNKELFIKEIKQIEETIF